MLLIIASERSEPADLVVSRARFFYIYISPISTALHTVMFYVILNTRKSNFAMRVNFITRTFHAAALARNNVMHCVSIFVWCPPKGARFQDRSPLHAIVSLTQLSHFLQLARFFYVTPLPVIWRVLRAPRAECIYTSQITKKGCYK